MTAAESTQRLVQRQREFFATGATLDVEFRIQALRRLQAAIQRRDAQIKEALTQDLGKSAFEGYLCEVGLTLAELRHQIRHVRRWAKPRRVPSDLANFHSTYRVVSEPYGVVLVMSPWNYPFMLSLEPLIGAVAAGNCCVVKPSAYSPATSAVISELIREVFQPGHVDVVLGGREENTALLEQRFDYLFFTGSPTVGKLVMEKASQHLTPVSLELGGKSPCIIAKDADLKLAARRLAFGKWLNLGQTCIAPDYVLCHASVHDRFLELLEEAVVAMYGANALDNPDYGRIVNRKHFDRIMGLIDPAKVAFCAGPKQFADQESLRIAPVVMTGVTDQDPVMQEEIFGPVLPIIAVSGEDEAEAFVKSHEKPLALYLFSNSKATQRRFMERVSFGGGCVNDTIVHIATSRMGFGGVGNSGMGSYHGIQSFRTFSHQKSMLQKHNWIDLPLRYQPYEDWKAKVIRLFLR